MNKLISIFKNAGYVNNDNEKIVIYGLQKIKALFEDIALAIIGGAILGDVIAAIIYECAYLSLRIYAGGYHAGTEKKCKCLSFGSLVVSLMLIFCDRISVTILSGVMICSLLLIIRLAPVESQNKKLFHKEKEIYRIRCLIVAITETCIYVLCICIHQNLYAKAIAIAVIIVAIGLIPNMLQNMHRGKKTIYSHNYE